MKKAIILILLLILLIPSYLSAAAVTGATYSANNEVEIGEKYRIHVEPELNGFMPGYNYTVGYVMAYIEVIYDEEVFLLENVTIPHFQVDFSDETKIEDNHKLLLAQFDFEDTSYSCAYDELYCGDLKIDLDFFARNTKAVTSKIEIRNITIVYIDLDKTEEEFNNMTEEELENYVKENVKTTHKDVKISKTVNIKNNNNNTVQEPTVNKPTSPLKPIIVVPKEETPSITATPTETPKKSSNSYLRRLEIYNYKIDFNKDTKDYEISVSNNVNEINIQAETDDPEAIYKIIGASDLQANNNLVQIEVTAQDNSKSTYTIKVNHKEEQDLQEPKEEVKQEKKVKVKLDKKIIKLMAGIGIGFLLIIIIIVINSIRKKKALNKMFKDL